MSTCDARKPGFALRPLIGINSLPCVRPAGHVGDHRNVAGRSWPCSDDNAVRNGVTPRIVNASDTRGEELAALQAQASKLWERVLNGEDSPYLRTQIERMEALQAAFMMDDPALVAACACGSRRRVQEAAAA